MVFKQQASTQRYEATDAGKKAEGLACDCILRRWPAFVAHDGIVAAGTRWPEEQPGRSRFESVSGITVQALRRESCHPKAGSRGPPAETTG